MAIWMEIRCELRGDGEHHPVMRCESADNAGPMTMVDDDKKSFDAGFRILREQALNGGWKRFAKHGGWVCPACQHRIKKERGQEEKGNG